VIKQQGLPKLQSEALFHSGSELSENCPTFQKLGCKIPLRTFLGIQKLRKGQLLEISFGIFAGVLGLILSPWLARLLTHVDGWGAAVANLYWLRLILGVQTVYWLWRLSKHFPNS
jgi:hypothetical protein